MDDCDSTGSHALQSPHPLQYPLHPLSPSVYTHPKGSLRAPAGRGDLPSIEFLHSVAAPALLPSFQETPSVYAGLRRYSAPSSAFGTFSPFVHRGEKDSRFQSFFTQSRPNLSVRSTDAGRGCANLRRRPCRLGMTRAWTAYAANPATFRMAPQSAPVS
jgi:hypothetical protein